MRQETDSRRRPIAVLVFVAAAALAAGEAAAQSAGPEVLGFTKHFAVEITNPTTRLLENQAIVINVAEIRATVAADFNTYMYALFDATGGEYALVVSQADDLDRDRYHDEIVFVRTLPPSSTTRLLCYYTPNRSFQLMPTSKAFARGAWEAGGAEAGWESNLAAYKFVNGRIGFFGKLQPFSTPKGFRSRKPSPGTPAWTCSIPAIRPASEASACGTARSASRSSDPARPRPRSSSSRPARSGAWSERASRP